MEENKNLTRHSNQRLQSGPQNLVVSDNKLAIQNELTNEDIKSLIYTIRGKQVMLDSDVAMLYHYPTKRINETVNRNKQRFPENFCFQLTDKEYEVLRCKNVTLNQNTIQENIDNSLRSQIATLNENVGRGKHRKYLPYAFTEQGIAMLSGLLKNDIAIQVSIDIMNAFVEMRKFLMLNGQVFERLTNMEYKLLEHDKKFDEVFNQLQLEETIKQRIFFDGQIYDAYSLIIDIIKRANNKILIIDNYIDDSILKMLAKKKNNVEVVILTSDKSNIENLDVKKFNKEYPILKVAKTNKFHDRFMVIDNKEMYHLGASIKDLGKKCFAINRIEDIEIIEKIINL
ncbi:MAG: ORF6N domain-containing protein [Clostridia bacterium]|nr:ORF6N domain-containing protein [Clostridia bacterium]